MAEKAQEKVTPIVIDGFEINAKNVTYQKLQEFSLILFEKLLSQRQARNSLMLDRDKLRTILENTRHEINVAYEVERNIEEELERAEEKYRQDKKEVEQEVKWIHYEHGRNLTELKVWEGKELEKTAEKELEEELELLDKKRKLKATFAEQDRKILEDLENLKILHQEELTQLRNSQENAQIDSEMQFKRDLVKTVEEMNFKHEMEMSEIEERKNTHLIDLKKIHKTRLEEMKSHFNSITAENLTVISNMKENLEMMKKNKTAMLNEIKILKQKIDNIKIPLENSKIEARKLAQQVINYEKDLLSLKNNKRLLQKTVNEIKKVRNQSRDTQRQIKHTSLDTFDGLDLSCANSLVEYGNVAANKKKRLEELIIGLLDELEKKQNTIKALAIDPDVKKAFQDENVEMWNPNILNYELALICKAFDELLKTFQGKLIDFCVPESDLELKPLQMQYSGNGPAAIVSKQ